MVFRNVLRRQLQNETTYQGAIVYDSISKNDNFDSTFFKDTNKWHQNRVRSMQNDNLNARSPSLWEHVDS